MQFNVVIYAQIKVHQYKISKKSRLGNVSNELIALERHLESRNWKRFQRTECLSAIYTSRNWKSTRLDLYWSEKRFSISPLNHDEGKKFICGLLVKGCSNGCQMEYLYDTLHTPDPYFSSDIRQGFITIPLPVEIFDRKWF